MYKIVERATVGVIKQKPYLSISETERARDAKTVNIIEKL